MSKINKDVLELSSTYQKLITFDKDGVPTISERAVLDNLPEGVTEEMMVATSNARDLIFAAGAHAVGTVSESHLKKNKGQEKVTLAIPVVGKDQFTYTYLRDYETSAPGSTEKTMSHGRIEGKMEIYAASNKRGEFLKVRNELLESGAKLFGD